MRGEMRAPNGEPLMMDNGAWTIAQCFGMQHPNIVTTMGYAYYRGQGSKTLMLDNPYSVTVKPNTFDGPVLSPFSQVKE